ncbi:kinase-like domain-containing protein [Microdochium trichocladiopsis]|uniref:Kinase-like domain-containing protein n=1 Tax=Microdochium trichocladiopsis TaxID=1682393 RepID=A0A9P8XWC7_9PEZI|nr:kinase-like domain-containing protein [Microdochium trichocladiopsis]KAH7016296.1 kinase-like domain-containing protein [Microdochium trichocladiopsis]
MVLPSNETSSLLLPKRMFDEGQLIKGFGSGGIGQIKIADFGMSKILWNGRTETPCGTVGYSAPEIVNYENYSKSVDMWALGCVLYTLLCGFPPFYGESINVVTENVAKGQYAFLSPWWDDISESAQDLISHLLTVDPVKRYTIKEFLRHPWILQSGPSTYEEKKQPPSEVFCSFDALKIVDSRPSDTVSLREVLDVGTAVHQQGEEYKQRGIPSRLLASLNDESDAKENNATWALFPSYASKQRIVKSWVHAPWSSWSRQATSTEVWTQRMMWPQSRRVEIVGTQLTKQCPARVERDARWAVNIVWVFKPRWGKVAHGNRISRRRLQGILVRVRLCWLGLRVWQGGLPWGASCSLISVVLGHSIVR